MFLKKVEIAGFKSFAAKTTLEFLPTCGFGVGKKDKQGCGITAIVGPNGSGKSNVLDAVRWAMGEQSMKNLRGKKSEDIIFAGSGKKAKLSAASVTLHFDNSDKRIPIDFSEVTVSRKIYRSGEGEYLINGSRVRMLDIADLLAKAGVGKESYCVINQGMSDAVLNATPVDRRLILEDAAGVKQYQIKKERALRKLESTKKNLEQVDNIIVEIEPHLKTLKRQAEKALKGKDVAQALREKQSELYAFLWHTFQKEKEASLGEKNEVGAKMMNVQREVDIFNDELVVESKVIEDFHKQAELERKRNRLFQKINEAEKELIIAEGRIEIIKERNIREKIIESIPVDTDFVRGALERIKSSQEKLINRISGAETLAELQDIKEFARAIGQDIHDLFENIGKGELKVEKINPEYDRIQMEKEEALRKMASKRDETAKKIALLKSEIEESGREIEAEISKNKESRRKMFELEQKLRKKQEELNNLKDAFNEAKIRLARVEVREEDLLNEVRQELKTDVHELKYGGQPCDRDRLEKEIGRLKYQFEQIGGIDPMVVEEFQEVSQRFEFLTKESHDLKEAIASLREVVGEMEKKIDEVFSKAFQNINKEFTKYFRIIFGGGNAHLLKSKVRKRKPRVEDETDPVDDDVPVGDEEPVPGEDEEGDQIGVDIFACPPGKKIATLSMLSGGERSLTSLALLFAIISHNPPPFSVLDEVEAALDEANSRRFGRILQELSSDTQFIAITHNRETMRQASLLYGVTMGDDGISKVLSVKLDQVGQGGEIRK